MARPGAETPDRVSVFPIGVARRGRTALAFGAFDPLRAAMSPALRTLPNALPGACLAALPPARQNRWAGRSPILHV